MTGEETNRIKLIEQYGKELVEEASLRYAVMEYVETQVQVKEEEPTAETQTEETSKSSTETKK